MNDIIEVKLNWEEIKKHWLGILITVFIIGFSISGTLWIKLFVPIGEINDNLEDMGRTNSEKFLEIRSALGDADKGINDNLGNVERRINEKLGAIAKENAEINTKLAGIAEIKNKLEGINGNIIEIKSTVIRIERDLLLSKGQKEGLTSSEAKRLSETLKDITLPPSAVNILRKGEEVGLSPPEVGNLTMILPALYP